MPGSNNHSKVVEMKCHRHMLVGCGGWGCIGQISGTPMSCIWVKMDDVPFVRGFCSAIRIWWMLLVYHLSAWRSTNTCNLCMRKTETFVVFSSNSRQLHDSADVIRKRKMYYLFLVNEMLTITDTFQQSSIRREYCLKFMASSGHIRNIFPFIFNSMNESREAKKCLPSNTKLVFSWKRYLIPGNRSIAKN